MTATICHMSGVASVTLIVYTYNQVDKRCEMNVIKVSVLPFHIGEMEEFIIWRGGYDQYVVVCRTVTNVYLRVAGVDGEVMYFESVADAVDFLVGLGIRRFVVDLT